MVDPAWAQPRRTAGGILAQSEQIGCDAVEAPVLPSRVERQNVKLIVRSGRPFERDATTGEEHLLERPQDTSRLHGASHDALRSLEDLRRRPPVPTADEWLASGACDLMRDVIETLGQRYAIIAHLGSPMWGVFSSIGFERGMMAIHGEPELLRAFRDRMLHRQLERLDAFARVGIDVVWLEECFTSSDLVSPPQYCEWALPANCRIIEHAHRLGLRVIHYFCGDARQRLAMLAEANPDAIALEESKKGFEHGLDWVASQLPSNTCLLGNLDAVSHLQDGTSAQLSEEVHRQAASGRSHGRFILSLGSPVTPSTPIQRVREFTDIAHSITLSRRHSPKGNPPVSILEHRQAENLGGL